MTLPRKPLRTPRHRPVQPDQYIIGQNRLQPALGADAMKTYQIVSPISSHWRPATCAEVECPNHLYGWKTVVDLSTELGQAQAHFIKTDTSRKHTSYRTEDDGSLVVFLFEAGQTCFEQHQLRLEVDPLYYVKQGDWRGNPRGIAPRKHSNASNWVDDFATHQQTLADRLKRG